MEQTKKKRCPNGTQRNKKTGECEKKNKTPKTEKSKSNSSAARKIRRVVEKHARYRIAVKTVKARRLEKANKRIAEVKEIIGNVPGLRKFTLDGKTYFKSKDDRIYDYNTGELLGKYDDHYGDIEFL